MTPMRRNADNTWDVIVDGYVMYRGLTYEGARNILRQYQ